MAITCTRAEFVPKVAHSFKAPLKHLVTKLCIRINLCIFSFLAVTLPLSDPISALKARLHDETGMQAGKQKLQMENIFFKDSNTLAYYNIYPNTIVHLQVKERGGRKK